VCNAIWECLAREYIVCPQTPQQWLEKAERFQEVWQYPRGLGAIDGKHVVAQAFGNSGSSFRNYKHSFSVVLLAVADADYQVSVLIYVYVFIHLKVIVDLILIYGEKGLQHKACINQDTTLC